MYDPYLHGERLAQRNIEWTLTKNFELAALIVLLALSLVATANPQVRDRPLETPINTTSSPLPSAPYVRMFQIQNKPADPSPFLVYPASNGTIWIVAVPLKGPLVSQIVNFNPTTGRSTPIANVTNSVPSDIVYDNATRRVWILENDSLTYYNETSRKTTIAQTYPKAAPQYMTIDSQDHFWLTLFYGDQIVQYLPSSGTSYNYSTPTSNAGLQGITVSPLDGSIWFAEAYAGKIGQLIPCGTSQCPITEYSPPSGLSLRGVIQLAIAQNGVVWFTIHNGNEFGSFDPATGEWRLYPIGFCSDSYVPGCGAGLPNAISLDSQGQVWFAEHYSGRIGRYNPNSGALTEYAVPTKSAVCSEACPPYVWWMRPGKNNLIWFVALGLGEIGYVNATVSIPFTVTSLASMTVAQGKSASLPASVTYTGEAPSINASATSQDTYTNPPMLSWSVSLPASISGGIEASTVTVSAAWSSTLGSRYVAVSAYNGNVTVNVFVRVDVVGSLSAFTTIGFAGGISTISALAAAMAWYVKRKRNNGLIPLPD